MDDEEELNELKELWLEHIRKKVDKEGKRIWEEKNMSEEMMDEILNTHYRIDDFKEILQQEN
jgi:hypothetical protein